uniref:Cytosolic Fe-S cluster assembly factor NAR1 n=1 Tax=Coccidioides posadasii RMSCC 3488 TaxID=454284 RepID=A0A0J6I0S1_COCPO|nr:LET1 protein [Coccidioides posadasii RMSCC 3488]
MSAILSADDLNDFISPGVACIKPVETLPAKSERDESAYEVTTEDKVAAENPSPAQISLTDCLACSGCVTSAEAVLISLQSHAEVLNTLDAYPELRVDGFRNGVQNGATGDARIFVASVSPQVRASMAATYGVSEKEAGYMIEQFLSGPQGLRAGGQHGSGFTWVVDTNVIRDVVLELTTDEATASRAKFDSTATSESAEFPIPRKPILSSACPGWICYAEKTHPHVLPHLSRLKSPQALTGTFIKTILSKRLNVPPSRIWHLAIMPCFDKKLEASRQELTDASWQTTNHDMFASPAMDQPIRDVDCVITSRELLMLASSRNISLLNLPLTPLPSSFTTPFPDPRIAQFLFPKHLASNQSVFSGPSGGYLHHLLTTHQALHPNSSIQAQRGRNADVIDYTLVSAETGRPIIKAARYYGFRNIQNLVRKLKPAKTSRLPGARATVSRRTGTSAPHTAAGGGVSDYAYIEVMACPGGCTNGGGQIRFEDARDTATTATSSIDGSAPTAQTSQHKPTPQEQRAWLARVDEVYYSADSDSPPPSSPSTSHGDEMEIDRPLEPESRSQSVHAILQYWSDMTGIPLPKLVYTTFRKVESDVGKSKNGAADTARVAELAGKIGGGW